MRTNPHLEPLRARPYRFTRRWLQEQTRWASDPLGSAAGRPVIPPGA